ncbi:hypothetical protein [Dyella flagellata]|uniref:Aspartyl protease n=1 Tax=Dyella flagellata TaxID=1867833 RepID=A0ABQ5X6D6_9GAMM|nr:hypothetical protein [Dyella flagellata]GLQ86717.1 hypothetical protein GCM10007898_02830 [Dyella flagellata]
MLKIVDFASSTDYSCLVNVNEYVPITFRTQRQPLGGARYIRMGNFENNLLELIVSSDSMTLRGVTVTLVGEVGHNLMRGVDTGPTGLPVLELPGGTEFTGPASARRANIGCNFSLATSEDIAEISINENKDFDSRVSYGDVWFLIRNEELVGIRFLNLDIESISMIRSFNRV